jgi:hypothetical protein
MYICKKQLSLLFSVLPLCAFVSQANATTIYQTRGAFLSSLTNVIVDDYENPNYKFQQTNAEMGAVLGQTKYTSTGQDNVAVVGPELSGHYYCAGCNGSYLMDFQHTSISTNNTVYGVGFDYWADASMYGSLSDLYRVHAFVTFGDGSQQDILLNEGPWNDFVTSDFLGITSDLGIRSIAVGLANGGASKLVYAAQDNLAIGQKFVTGDSEIPEPSSIAVIGLAAAGLSFARRRQI